MIPFLLDTLTLVFIFGGFALLWVNLRNSRQRNITVTRKHGSELEKRIAPMNIGGTAAMLDEGYPVETSQLSKATCRAQASECLRQAETSTDQINRDSWLLMAAEWTKLSGDELQPSSAEGARLNTK